MKILKYPAFFASFLFSLALNSQTQTHQITAALVDLGGGSIKVTFTPNNALSGTPVPLNVYIKVPSAEFAGTTVSLGANPFGLAEVSTFNHNDGFGYFYYQTLTQPPISSWAVGDAQDIVTFNISGQATQVLLSGGDFGGAISNGQGGFFWPGTSLAVENTSTNLVSWPVSSSVAILPVEMTFFWANMMENNTTELTWRTETELNNQGFDIERSFDGQKWEKIGYQTGNGTTTIPHEYRFIDEAPQYGINYYRLRQMDYDGTFEYSDTRSVLLDKAGETFVRIFPNPIGQGELNIVLSADWEDNNIMHLYSPTGQMVRQKALSNFNNILEVSDLPPGVYLLEIRNRQKAWHERVVIH